MLENERQNERKIETKKKKKKKEKKKEGKRERKKRKKERKTEKKERESFPTTVNQNNLIQVYRTKETKIVENRNEEALGREKGSDS